jgi:hypothetical protein
MMKDLGIQDQFFTKLSMLIAENKWKGELHKQESTKIFCERVKKISRKQYSKKQIRNDNQRELRMEHEDSIDKKGNTVKQLNELCSLCNFAQGEKGGKVYSTSNS